MRCDVDVGTFHVPRGCAERRHARQLEEDAAALGDGDPALRAHTHLGRAASAKPVPARCNTYVKTQVGSSEIVMITTLTAVEHRVFAARVADEADGGVRATVDALRWRPPLRCRQQRATPPGSAPPALGARPARCLLRAAAAPRGSTHAAPPGLPAAAARACRRLRLRGPSALPPAAVHPRMCWRPRFRESDFAVCAGATPSRLVLTLHFVRRIC